MRIVQFVFAKSDLVSHTSRLKDLIPLVACLMNFLVESNFFWPEIISIDFQAYKKH